MFSNEGAGVKKVINGMGKKEKKKKVLSIYQVLDTRRDLLGVSVLSNTGSKTHATQGGNVSTVSC